MSYSCRQSEIPSATVAASVWLGLVHELAAVSSLVLLVSRPTPELNPGSNERGCVSKPLTRTAVRYWAWTTHMTVT